MNYLVRFYISEGDVYENKLNLALEIANAKALEVGSVVTGYNVLEEAPTHLGNGTMIRNFSLNADINRPEERIGSLWTNDYEPSIIDTSVRTISARDIQELVMASERDRGISWSSSTSGSSWTTLKYLKLEKLECAWSVRPNYPDLPYQDASARKEGENIIFSILGKDGKPTGDTFSIHRDNFPMTVHPNKIKEFAKWLATS